MNWNLNWDDDTGDAQPDDVKPKRQLPSCPYCGGTTFSWGRMRGQYWVKFVSDDEGWLARNTVFGGTNVRARLCDTCGNIALFADY